MRLFLTLLMLCAGPSLMAAEAKKVMIGADLYSIEVLHKGQKVTLMRNQNPDNKIDPFYQRTNQGTIQPLHPFAPHAVETIGELEMIDYLVRFSKGDNALIIIDSRTPDWVARGTIPGAINIPFTEFNDNEKLLEIMEKQFDVTVADVTDFTTAKTVVMFCNGIWCGQSPTAIRKLLAVGYPAAKIKYFRGGMQNWQALGLTVVKP
ncbi:MAG TPA: rhodanese-like domain-containing protein [Gammaproteobacteria bacterium]